MTAGRSLASTEAKGIAQIGMVLLVLAAVAVIFPRLFVIPFAVVLAWMGVTS